MILKKPFILFSIYFLGFSIEYLTPACAAKLYTNLNFFFLNKFSVIFLLFRFNLTNLNLLFFFNLIILFFF